MEAQDHAVTEDVKEERKKSSANMASDAVAAYLRSIKGHALLTADEEKKLFKKAKKGDMRAREAIINANLRLPIYVAKKYLYKVSHLKMSDLIQAGNEGLIKAVSGFDLKLGCRFSTYATYWIRQALERELGNNEQVIRSPIHVVESLKRYNKAVRLLAHKLDRTPTASEIAEEMKESEEWVRKRTSAFKRYVSLDEQLPGGNSEYTFGDFIEGSDGTEVYTSVLQSEFRERFVEIFKNSPLDEKQKTVLRLRYGMGSDTGEELTLDAIGEILGLTRERIRQIEAKALRKIKKYLTYSSQFKELA